jgi:hypothetical protein
MDENINESVETQEVAEPETEDLESAENPEVAEPESEAETPEEDTEEGGRSDSDAAFAEMRRNNQKLERENRMMFEALQRYFDGEDAEEIAINANAYAEQKDPDDYREEWEHNQEFEAALAENEDLREQLLSVQAEKLMRDDLAAIQEIDPTVKSLDDLGETFLKMRLNGEMSPEEAFYACKAIELKDKVLAPDAIGRVADTKAERDYYTLKEIDEMSDEELYDNYDKVLASMSHPANRKKQ